MVTEKTEFEVNLGTYNNSWYNPGSPIKRFLWMVTSFLFFTHGLAVLNLLKIFLLKLFGASVGKGVIIKPSVNIKYPWFLTIGDNCWIGEKVWIDNLANVRIGNNVCLSQGSMLLTGNHNFSKSTFDLIIKPIILEDGAWIGAHAIVCPGVSCFKNSVLTVQSVASKDLQPNTINQGNPAKPVKERIIIS